MKYGIYRLAPGQWASYKPVIRKGKHPQFKNKKDAEVALDELNLKSVVKGTTFSVQRVIKYKG